MCRRPTVVSGLCDAYTYSDLIRNANTLAHVFRCSGLVARRPPWLPLGTSKPGPSADEEGIGAARVFPCQISVTLLQSDTGTVQRSAGKCREA